jgi:SOS-response transcriptional repressor LexA
MKTSSRKLASSPEMEWATPIRELRKRLNLNQADFGRRLHSSAMGVSRWERGSQEPSASGYIELGNLSGVPQCWYFWARAGLRVDDLMRLVPEVKKSPNRIKVSEIEIPHSSAKNKASKPQLVAIPLLNVTVAAHGGETNSAKSLYNAPIECMIPALAKWCPNPSTTTCLRVRGNSMEPLICDGFVLAVDSSQKDPSELNGRVVIAWNKDMGFIVSRLNRYDRTEVLQPDNGKYESIVMGAKQKWKIFAKVLWWIGNAP